MVLVVVIGMVVLLTMGGPANLARQELYFNRFMSLDEMLESIEAVTRDEVQRIAREFFREESIALAMLGRLGDVKLKRSDLSC